MSLLLELERVFVAYVPVVHRGLIEACRREKLPVFVLAKEFLADFPKLEHDLRAVTPAEAVTMLGGVGCWAEELDWHSLSLLLKNEQTTFVLPFDEVMIAFAEKYLAGRQVEYSPVFLRWNKINTVSEEGVSFDRQAPAEEFSHFIMDQCRHLAVLSSDWWRQVGAAAARGEYILLIAANRHQPTDYSPYIDGDIRFCFDFGERLEICGAIHAEAAVVAEAAARGLPLAGADFYTTTFPCPMCARLIVGAKIRRLFYETGYSVCDANDILAAGGVEIIKLVS